MKNETAISNEKIIAALMQHGTIKEAARTAGTTPRAIYDRMKDKDFRAEYLEAKNEIIRAALISLNANLSDAIKAVADIMRDPNTNPAVRLQAAQTIINNAGKFADRLTTGETNSREEGKGPFDDIMENWL